MTEDEERPAPDDETWRRIDQVVLTIARLLGRQMARDACERRQAANDNRPPEEGRD